MEGHTLDGLLEEERSLVLPSFNEDDAISIGLMILERARRDSLVVAIEVHRCRRLIFKAALPGTRPQNDYMLSGKRRIVERWAHSSLYERLRHEADGTTFQQVTGLPFPEYAPFGGGVPIFVGGAVPIGGPVGIAIVSGLAHEDDHDLVVQCLQDYSGTRA
jgi:uncharacterized protein (UPF0303 family)